ncbi:hypothetical protein CEXT_716971 [Caerostris extrusa]|uniref:Uncharacterized protein n=1 Tax=Caerostris extrusa TaxID=172846 RepID=A0AAV4P8R1_CAEEX|nr:hypothetical protein CEXT_716971 [Caerostris extrusa]
MGSLKKNLVFLGDVAALDVLKNYVRLPVQSITPDQLRSAVKHIVHCFEILLVNEGNQIEHLSLHRRGQD